MTPFVICRQQEGQDAAGDNVWIENIGIRPVDDVGERLIWIK